MQGTAIKRLIADTCLYCDTVLGLFTASIKVTILNIQQFKQLKLLPPFPLENKNNIYKAYGPPLLTLNSFLRHWKIPL